MPIGDKKFLDYLVKKIMNYNINKIYLSLFYKSDLFIEAAKSLGAGPIWIVRKYLFRNVITSIPVLLTLNAADAVLILGGLGFLGLGLPESIGISKL